MLELKNDTLHFSFPDVHPDAKVSFDFQRALRIPDDDKQYALPPGLGKFPTKQIDDIPPERIPAAWKEHGGVMIPMYQSEALWISFNPHRSHNRASAYPFAIRVATGKVSAITGKVFVKKLKEGDYLVIPFQPWLDGFVVGDGFVRQFVASPLGSGVSVEQQITGEDKVGGIQIEVIPMKSNIFNEKFPEEEDRLETNLYSRSLLKGLSKSGSVGAKSEMILCCEAATASPAYPSPEDCNPDMSLAAGGKMKQQVFEDKFGIDVWDTENTSRVFVHLTNSMVWRSITGTEPPSVPLTARDYTSRGLPWFDYYADAPTVKPTDEMKDIKSMKDMPGGKSMLPENESVDETNNVKDLSPEKKKNPNEVREGDF